MLTHYDVLGVDPAADLETIRRAWRLKVRLLHPDRHQDSPPDVQAEAAKETLRANLAWDILRDADKRHRYDARVLQRDVGVDRENGEPASEGRPEWLSPNNYLNLVSFLIVVVATGFVIAGAVLLARMTQ